MDESKEALRIRLNAETARLAWPELERHFARGVVIKVATDLDLIEAATQIIQDDKPAVATWMEAGQIGHPTLDDARDWVERQPDFWTVVVAPWVLIQEVVTTAE